MSRMEQERLTKGTGEAAEEVTGRAFLIGLVLANHRSQLDIESSLEELGLLADTAGLEVVGQTHQRVTHPDPATYIGSGKVEEVRNWIAELRADIVIFDDELAPRNQRELEAAFGENVRVLDRTALILDIFAQHAATREGYLQVALAQYEYRLPRLTRQWTHLARQAGGGAVRGGAAGVGLRGPGETQLEVDRREIRRHISTLKAELDEVRAHRERYRARRRKAGIPVAALVGYTNAGKSTLLNAISGASVYSADKLFATLDPTTRRVQLPSGQKILLTDTVGFIQKLPHSLVAAFRATLEEVIEADILLHIIDVSHPNVVEQTSIVEQTLVEELGIRDKPIVAVFNKIDLYDPDESEGLLGRLKNRYPQAIFVSALRRTGITSLLESMAGYLDARQSVIALRIPYTEGELIARFHSLASDVIQHYEDSWVSLEGRIPAEYCYLFEKYSAR